MQTTLATKAARCRQAHEDETAAFRALASAFGERTVLLVDTDDTPRGVERAIEVDQLTETMQVFASGGLDEYEIERLLLHENAPIDGFGIGTALGVSDDAPDVACTGLVRATSSDSPTSRPPRIDTSRCSSRRLRELDRQLDDQ